MKIFKTYFYPLIIVLAVSLNSVAQSATPGLQVLAKYPNVRDFTMSPNGNEAYVTMQSPLGDRSVIAVVKKTRGKWQKPELASFSGKFTDLEASFSPDGSRLYFVSSRPLNKSDEKPKDMDIWYVERSSSNSNWSEPKNIGAPVNSKGNEFYPSVAANGNLYFTLKSDKSKGEDDIFLSEWKNGGYTEPVSLGEAINTKGAEYNAYIAPDESFLIFGGWRRKDGLGSGDMYISYRDRNGVWSKAKNMGKRVNSRYMEFCPFVDWKTKTLYFTSRRSSVSRKRYDSLEAFESEIFKYENGLSRIYKIDLTGLANEN
ncbi:MAG: hypothetical protein HKN25_06525 [Pyrinomonadaceae bacterium]|nr:hypothetical protein [Pyrinomonadaceae bacterium]